MDRFEDRMAIEGLISRYAWAFDMRDFDTLGECFADECEFDSSPREFTPVVPFPARGRDEIVAVLSAVHGRSPSTQRRHVTTNVIIDFLGEDRAAAKSYMTVVFTEPGCRPVVVLAGHYEDLLEFTTSRGWRFRQRTVHSDGPT